MKNLLKYQEKKIMKQEINYITCIIKSIMNSLASVYQDKQKQLFLIKVISNENWKKMMV